MTRRRLAAAAALILFVVLVVLVVSAVVTTFPRGIYTVICFVIALAAAWFGLIRRGWLRAVGLGTAVIAVIGGLVLEVVVGRLLRDVLILLCGVLALAAARVAFRVRVPLPPVAAPHHPVLFWNPRSGGGKAEQHDLPNEARTRGIQPVELRPGDDLEALARDAVTRGADGLAVAGGDGSQAVVAAIAAEHHLPYACIPAGTRNHFALDLGVDREDVVGALDAFVDGGEHVVDLGEVNGRVFVNNVSLGLYGEAVQRPGYRESKLKTVLDVVPEMLGTEARAGTTEPGVGLRWTGPNGTEHRSGVAILVSNNRYRLGAKIGAGTRPRIDDGLLGIVVANALPTFRSRGSRPERPVREWSSPQFDVEADGPVPVGIDGEAATLTPPLNFRVRPAVLRARIARSHPGASPSAMDPEGFLPSLQALLHIAIGRSAPPLPPG